jgi:hypothetical protein
MDVVFGTGAVLGKSKSFNKCNLFAQSFSKKSYSLEIVSIGQKIIFKSISLNEIKKAPWRRPFPPPVRGGRETPNDSRGSDGSAADRPAGLGIKPPPCRVAASG